MKRRGFSLVEMLIATVVIAAAIAVSTVIYTTAWGDAPRIARAVESHRQVGLALAWMQRDVDAALALPASADELLIRRPEGVVGYAFGDDEIRRFTVTPAGRRVDRTWPARDAEVRWKVWEKKGRRYAVEVRSWVAPEMVDGPPQRNLANARVFFLPPPRKGGAP